MEKRLFIGIKLEPENELVQIMQSLRHNMKDSGIKWVEYDNLHLTLMFLGNVDINNIYQIKEKLKPISDEYKSFKASLSDLGCFKKKGKISVIWIGVKGDGKLEKLADKVISGMKTLDLNFQNSTFKPHLTIGRIKAGCKEDILERQIKYYQNKYIQEISVEEFSLFESILKPRGPQYLILERFKLCI